MINARIPLFVIHVIGNFYSKLSGLVYSKGSFSNEFKTRNDTRQGGIISAVLYNFYIIDLICSLRDSGFDCEIGSEYCDVIYYANNIVS